MVEEQYLRAKELFIKEKKSLRQIAEETGLNRKQLSVRFKEEGINCSKKGRSDVIFSKDLLDEAIKMYKSGSTLQFIAEHFNVSRSSLSIHLEESNLREQEDRTEWKIKNASIDLKDVYALFQSGMNLTDLGEKLGISRATVYRRLTEAGYDLARYWRIYEVNHDYFKNLDTHEKNYWFGFLFADGCITKEPTRFVEFGLQIEDIDSINNFALAIGYNGPTKLRIVKSNALVNMAKEINFSRVQICSNKMVSDLENHGLIERKSLTKTMPNIQEEFLDDFIRGYFDGNGCIFVQDDKKRVSFSITTGSKAFIDKLYLIMIKRYNLNKTSIYKKLNDKSGNSAYTIQWTSKRDLCSLYESLYKNSTVNTRLMRKYIKFSTFYVTQI